uniref:DUF499 domain-containing protein n=1 Tax=Fervidicoccus fontis TaxID=683846 RepID=A0A7J3ZK20_9CREN
MRPVGQVFRLKTPLDKLKEELVPSFDSVLEEWISDTKRTSFADPGHVLEVTCPTPPLRMFIERVGERLKIPVVVGSSLERGFGFGKTHALILLWHLFTSDIYRQAYQRSSINVPEGVVRETLVLGIDCSRSRPLARIVEELKAYTNPEHPVARVKEPKLLGAVAEVLEEYERELYALLSDGDRLAELVAKILERYAKRGGTPRLLLLVDELGWGLAQKLRVFADRMREGRHREAERAYSEANAVVNFLSYLYAKLHGKPVAGVVIWVVAEQDRREIKALAEKNVDNELIRSKIEGLLGDLDVVAERYSRGLSGTSLAELSYSPEHALEIARYRVLRTVDGFELSKLQDEYIAWLENIARQLNLVDVFMRYKEELKRFYPFSLGLTYLLRKVMSVSDAPATEFVRAVIGIAGDAAQNALSVDPEGSYTISVKHLSIPGVVQARLMREFEIDWANAVGDVELALPKASPEEREATEIAAKYILAKGVTANILTVLESREQRDLERYGSTVEEIQLEVVESFTEGKALEVIERLSEALEKLRAESARIDEREVKGKRYYLPSLFRTIYNKLAAFVHEERKNLESKSYVPVYIKQTGTIPSLFVNLRITVDGRSDDVVVSLMEYRRVRDVELLLSDPAFQEAQNKGKLLLIVVPPWDIELFNEMYVSKGSYESIVSTISNGLQNAVKRGRIRRHLHAIVLVPELSEFRMNTVLDKIVEHEGTKKFLEYLSKKEDILNERLREYEGVTVKRMDLLTILSEEVKKRHLRELRSRIEREIADARSFAQSQLVRLSRDIAASVLQLYRKVVYYSLDANRFSTKEIAAGEEAVKDAERLADAIKTPNLKDYAAIVNKFLADIIRELAYESNAMKVASTLVESYREEFERGILRERDRIEEVVENILLGTYGVKPLSASIAREAVLKYLNKQRIELEDRDITIVVNEDSGAIEFHVTPKPPKAIEGVEGESTTGSTVSTVTEITDIGTITEVKPERTIQRALLELPAGFDVSEISQRLVALINLLRELDAEISFLKLGLDTESISLHMTLKGPIQELLADSNVRTAMNLLSRVSRAKGKAASMEIYLSKPVAEDNVSKVFGECLKARRSSIDRFLPT